MLICYPLRVTLGQKKPSYAGFSFIINCLVKAVMAERVGFEPSERLRAQRFSRPPRSTTPATLRLRLFEFAMSVRQALGAQGMRTLYRTSCIGKSCNRNATDNSQIVLRDCAEIEIFR